jgi:flavin reductase (DIM6/NTAB) family NADH-FMN oxidoreductase RutF
MKYGNIKDRKKGGRMPRETIEINTLKVQPHNLFDHQWCLLTAGDYTKQLFNTMTIGWGALGTMWSRPFAFVAVRHSRYTYEFMQKFDTFTISAFPSDYKKALSYLGNHSGRDGDKITASGLTPEPSISIPAPSFAEAELVIECRKIYADDLNPVHFIDQTIYKHYPKHDFHRIYYGQIVGVTGVEKYRA